MIHELRTYTLQPGAQAEYLRLNREVGRQVRGDRFGRFEGGWTTELGMLNQYVHLWSYADLEERARLRAALARETAWTAGYIPQIRPLVVAQETKILLPVDGIPFTPPAGGGHLYELRWYRAHMARLDEWLALFSGVLPARRKYSLPVGVWRTEIGQLNEVVHLWAYDDLNHRARVRRQALEDPAWQAYLAASAPLLQTMQATILVPTQTSPLQ